jgi:parallel beta-helix repeat protein
MRTKYSVRKVSFTVLLLASIASLILIGNVRSQTSPTTVFIQSDGNVNPQNVPIQRNGDTYTFTGNVYDPILIQKSNVTLDGAGYSLIGTLSEEQKNSEPVLGLGPNTTFSILYVIGIDLDKNVSGVTIKNVNVDNFSVGIYVRTTHNVLIDNRISDNIVGILLSGSSDTLNKNYIDNNKQGLFFGFQQINGSANNIPSDIKVSQNSFINNSQQLSGCVCKQYNFSEIKHSWDYGNQGNYWSNYNGTDSDNDDVGDTPYIIDVLNQDRYPLMQSIASPPVPKLSSQIPIELLIIGIAIPLIVIIAIVFMLKRRKNVQI